MKNNCLFALFLITTLLFCGCKNNGPAVKLVLQYKPGDTLRLVTETIADGGGGISMNSSVEMKLRVDSVVNGTYILTARIARIYSKTVTGSETEELDSDKDRIPSFHSNYMKGEYSLKLDKTGKIIEPLTDKQTGRNEAAMFDMQRAQILLPGKAIKTGDSWNGEYKNALTGGVVKHTCTLTKVSGTEVHISVSALITGGTGLLAPQKITGEYTLNKNTGRLIRARLESPTSMGGTFVQTIYSK